MSPHRSCILHKIAMQWQHLKTLRVLGSYKLYLEAVADARSNGKLPALLNVCIECLGHRKELHRIRGVSTLTEMGVSCHVFVCQDCPFAAYKCDLCHKSESNQRL